VVYEMIEQQRRYLVESRLALQTVLLRVIAFGVLATLFLPVVAGAQFYSFEDKNGAMHFVDDPGKIPKEYRKQTQVRKDKYDDLSEEERAYMLEKDRLEREAAKGRETEQAKRSRSARLEKERLAELERRRKAFITPVIISGLQVFVPVVLVNGSTEVQANLLLDTGATSTVITPEVAARLNIEEFAHTKVRVVGGKVLSARRTVLTGLRVGPISRADQPVIIVAQRGGGFGDGLIGMSFLAGLKYTIDFQNQTINWMP
jgi:predicted aspartyl protease